MPPKKAARQNSDKTQAARSTAEKVSEPVVEAKAERASRAKADEGSATSKKARSKPVDDAPYAVTGVTSDTDARKTPNIATKEKPTAKETGKKRAVDVDEVEAEIASEPKSKKSRAKPVVSEIASKTHSEPVLDEREVIAALSDVSDDAGDEEDDGDSSEEDEEDDKLAQRSSMASIKLPNSKDDAMVKQRLEKLKKSKKNNKNASTPGTLYIGRLPKGFFEDQMKSYFTQFGDVTRLRVSRNKKTGASKHYAFVEFADKDVANIVQETMNNYLIDGALLQVRTVPKDKIHPEMWIGANRKYRPIPGARLERLKRDEVKTEEQQKVTIQRTLNRQGKRKAKLADAGFEYDFQGYSQDIGLEADDKATKKPSSRKTNTAA